jgi:hypothetical protein
MEMNDQELRQMGMECIRIISKAIAKEITQEEYYSGLMDLDRRYPSFGHDPPLTPFQIRNYRSIETVETSDKGVRYVDHLRPWNFKEAAEMYIRSVIRPGKVVDFKRRSAEPEEEITY